MRIVAARLPGEARRGGLVLEADILELGAGGALHHRVGARRIVEEIADALLVGAQEGIDLGDARHENAGGAHQRQRGDTARVAHRELGRDPAAEIVADEMDVRQIELVEQIEIEARKIRDGVEPGGRVRRAEARMLRRDNVMARCQVGQARRPEAGIARAMQKEERAPGAGAPHRDIAAADVDVAGGRLFHVAFSRRAGILSLRNGGAKGPARTIDAAIPAVARREAEAHSSAQLHLSRGTVHA